MRAWRKIYSTILDSEQVAQLSDGAGMLLTLLIAAQDDAGYYPWTPAKVRRLTAARPSWTLDMASTFAQELVAAEIAVLRDGGIVLVNGKELNGNPRNDREPDFYQRPGAAPLVSADGGQMTANGLSPGGQMAATDSLRAEQSRVEKSRVEESRGEAPAAGVFKAYEDNIAMLTPMVADEITFMLDQGIPEDWFIAAISEAAAHNARSWKYIKAILDRWKAVGVKDNGPKGKGQRQNRPKSNPLTWADVEKGEP